MRESIVTPGSPVPAGLWRCRDLRWLMTGEAAWLLGHRFYLITLPWLVLQLSDVAAMGIAILLAGLSRVVLMPVGGALSDRLSARALMLGASVARAGLLAWLTWQVCAGQVDLWVLYGANLAYGLTEALYHPARNAMTPLLVQRDYLRAANSFAGGLEQFCGLIGPALAGGVIAWMGGVQVALAVAFVATGGSVIALWRMAPRQARPMPEPIQSGLDLFSSIREVMVYVWRHRAIRTPFLMVVAINALTAGPLWIGLPMLIGTRLPGDAAALGLVTAALGAGALLGAALAGLWHASAPEQMGRAWVVSIGVCGAGLLVLAGVASTLAATLVVLAMGACISYASVTAITLLQHHTPCALMGRMMSLAAMK